MARVLRTSAAIGTALVHRACQVAFCAAIGALLVSCAAESESVPSDLVGVWETRSPGYADRSFEVTLDHIAFDTGSFSASDRHPLSNVAALPEDDGWSVYRLDFRATDGGLDHIEVQLRHAPAPELRFANRNQIWTRRAPRTVTP